MGSRNSSCCCTCDELLGVGTNRVIKKGDEIRVFTAAGGTGSVPFQGTFVENEGNTIIVDPPGSSDVYVRFCCAHITAIELVKQAPAPA
jgi:hypothetical protein